MASTHYSKFIGQFEPRTDDPVGPATGQEYYDTDDHQLKRYSGSAWQTLAFNTTTSTSTSTTTTSTSTSTTTTSTSSSTSTTTSSSTSTSTTTTV